MRAIWRASHEVISNQDVPSSERVFPWAESGCGNGIRHEDGSLESGATEVILEGKEVDMHAIGNEAQPKLIAQGKCPLDDVVMSVHLHRATIAHMSEHGKTMADG